MKSKTTISPYLGLPLKRTLETDKSVERSGLIPRLKIDLQSPSNSHIKRLDDLLTELDTTLNSHISDDNSQLWYGVVIIQKDEPKFNDPYTYYLYIQSVAIIDNKPYGSADSILVTSSSTEVEQYLLKLLEHSDNPDLSYLTSLNDKYNKTND